MRRRISEWKDSEKLAGFIADSLRARMAKGGRLLPSASGKGVSRLRQRARLALNEPTEMRAMATGLVFTKAADADRRSQRQMREKQ